MVYLRGLGCIWSLAGPFKLVNDLRDGRVSLLFLEDNTLLMSKERDPYRLGR